jgi:hypothetical protein
MVAFIQPAPQWARHAASLAVYLAAVAAVSVWLVYRGWRAGVRFDDRGLTIRYVLGSYRCGWSEVGYFEDGCRKVGFGEDRDTKWVLKVGLRDGRVLMVKATARGRSAASEVLTAVSQALERYGIQASLTGRMPGDKADASLGRENGAH